jgi:hypothetical protein
MNSKWPEVEDKLTLITAWARDGLTDADIAHNLGISTVSLWKYKAEHISLFNALKVGKEVADITVENALYKRCIGYSYEEITTERAPVYNDYGKIIKHEMLVTKRVTKEVLPDPVSTFFWLKNRKKLEWRDKHEIEKVVEVRVPMLEEVLSTFKQMRQLNKAEVITIDLDFDDTLAIADSVEDIEAE